MKNHLQFIRLEGLIAINCIPSYMANEKNDWSHVVIIITTRHFTCNEYLHDKVWALIIKESNHEYHVLA